MAKFNVGDEIRRIDNFAYWAPRGYVANVLEDGKTYEGNDGRVGTIVPEQWELVEAPASSPVRTITRREIVPGNYGTVGVQTVFNGKIGIFVPAYQHSPDELRAAARIFNEIADVLDEQSAETKDAA